MLKCCSCLQSHPYFSPLRHDNLQLDRLRSKFPTFLFVNSHFSYRLRPFWGGLRGIQSFQAKGVTFLWNLVTMGGIWEALGPSSKWPVNASQFDLPDPCQKEGRTLSDKISLNKIFQPDNRIVVTYPKPHNSSVLSDKVILFGLNEGILRILRKRHKRYYGK